VGPPAFFGSLLVRAKRTHFTSNTQYSPPCVVFAKRTQSDTKPNKLNPSAQRTKRTQISARAAVPGPSALCAERSPSHPYRRRSLDPRSPTPAPGPARRRAKRTQSDPQLRKPAPDAKRTQISFPAPTPRLTTLPHPPYHVYSAQVFVSALLALACLRQNAYFHVYLVRDIQSL